MWVHVSIYSNMHAYTSLWKGMCLSQVCLGSSWVSVDASLGDRVWAKCLLLKVGGIWSTLPPVSILEPAGVTAGGVLFSGSENKPCSGHILLPRRT